MPLSSVISNGCSRVRLGFDPLDDEHRAVVGQAGDVDADVASSVIEALAGSRTRIVRESTPSPGSESVIAVTVYQSFSGPVPVSLAPPVIWIRSPTEYWKPQPVARTIIGSWISMTVTPTVSPVPSITVSPESRTRIVRESVESSGVESVIAAIVKNPVPVSLSVEPLTWIRAPTV